MLGTRSNTARRASRCLLAWETPRRVDTSAVEASGVNTVAVALPSCLCNRQHSARLEATTTTTRRDGSCGEDPVRREPEYRAGEARPYACANKAGWRCPCRPRRQRDARARRTHLPHPHRARFDDDHGILVTSERNLTTTTLFVKSLHTEEGAVAGACVYVWCDAT